METPETFWFQAYFCRNFHRSSAFVEIYQVANHTILRKFQKPKNLSVEGFQLFPYLVYIFKICSSFCRSILQTPHQSHSHEGCKFFICNLNSSNFCLPYFLRLHCLGSMYFGHIFGINFFYLQSFSFKSFLEYHI